MVDGKRGLWMLTISLKVELQRLSEGQGWLCVLCEPLWWPWCAVGAASAASTSRAMRASAGRGRLELAGIEPTLSLTAIRLRALGRPGLAGLAGLARPSP